MANKIIDRGVRSLQAHGVIIDREIWLKEAEISEKLKPPMIYTCRAIVKAVVDLGVEDEDRKRTWMADAEECLKRRSLETARAIYQHALTIFPAKKSVWWRAAMLERDYGTREHLEYVLKKAVQYCPQATVLWLMGAKEKWLKGDVDRARLILAEAFRANTDSEDIWIAAFKIEFATNEVERARKLLEKARSQPISSTPRIWMKSAIVERRAGDIIAQRNILQEGVRKYPTFWKLWIMYAQLEEKQGNVNAARTMYLRALKNCMEIVPLWINYSALEEKLGNENKARALLEQGRLKNPKNEQLWLAAIRLELHMQNRNAADVQLAKALQDCPQSGLLWSQAVAMVPRTLQKARCMDALKNCDNNAYVICTVAQLFWHDRKVGKARSWFMRAVTLKPNVGDFWAFLYCFELQHGLLEQQAAVLENCQVSAMSLLLVPGYDGT
jgi:pre-mRNA-processing factor 6